ncbi:hypothetical protein QUF58_01840 [Anaerolineales bacterium HSG24]|nr:hypothetical protein [Anaerolineales bacterium HSG24]
MNVSGIMNECDQILSCFQGKAGWSSDFKPTLHALPSPYDCQTRNLFNPDSMQKYQ